MKTINPNFKLNAIVLGIALSTSSAYAATTQIANTDTNNIPVNSGSQRPALNFDGTIAVFTSSSENIIAGESGITRQIYKKNLVTQTVERISVSPTGDKANALTGFMAASSISHDGRYIVFTSSATNLLNYSYSNALQGANIFIRDSQLNTTKLINTTVDAKPANKASFNPVISGNGKFVVFESDATNLTNTNTLGVRQVYIKDINTGSLEIVSLNNSGAVGNGISFYPSISDDGRYIAFASLATNLASSDPDIYNVYVHDRQTKTTELVTAGANGHSSAPAISGDGRYVAFLTMSTNLVTGDTKDKFDIIVYNRNSKSYRRVEKSGVLPDNSSFYSKFSSDGRSLAFYSSATNLVEGDTNNRDDIFVYDLALKTIERVSVNTSGGQSSFNVDRDFSISGDGKVVAFVVGGDFTEKNSSYDVYARHRDPLSSGAPIAKAASIATQECTNGSAYVTLNGTNSVDNSSEGLSYTWTGPFGTVTGATPSVYLGVGSHSITLKVASDWGSDTTTINVTVTDTKSPSISADAPVNLEATSSNGAAHVVGFNATDACKLAGTTVSPSPVYYPLGTTNVTVTAKDTVGRTATASTSVTVKDTTAPVLNIPGDKIIEASAVRTTVNIGSATATDYFLADITNNAPADYPLNTTLVTWTAKDTSNNSTSKVQRVTVVDTTKPVLTIPGNKSVEATATLSIVNIGTAAASDIFPVTITNNAPAKFPVGTTTVTWNAKDANNNSTSASQLITLTDNTAPVITAPADITVEATGVKTTVSLISATASDTVGIASITNNAPASFPVGTTTVTWTATDKAGNTSTATQKVTVQDTIAPVISTPINVNVEATSELSSVIFKTPTVTDAVGVTSFVNDAPATFPVGTTTITWTATDAAGNFSTATQTVTVSDTTAPEISLPVNIEVEATAAESIVVFEEPTVTDIVGVASFTNDAPATFPVGTTTITWKAKDAAGNTTTATQTVKVVDTTAPVITAPVAKTAEASGIQTSVLIGMATATDVVGVEIITSDAPATFPIGKTTVIWTATDKAGNTSTATQLVTVEDTTAPIISVPVNVKTEATAPNSIVDFVAPVASDAVGVSSFVHDAPATFPVGKTIITWTAKDAAGNTTTATQTITVTDTTAPVISVPMNVEVEATALNSSVAYQSPTASDIVGVTSFESDAPASFPVGTTTITWTAKDAAGNTTITTQTIKVNDTTPANLTLPANMTVEANGNPSSIANLGTAKAIDIVDGDISANVKVAEPAGGYVLGANSVKYSITDNAGNISTGTQTVTIVDTTAPELTVSPASLIEVIATAELTEIVIGQAKASDFYLKSISNDHPSSYYPVGETVVTWTAEDTSGNKTTYTQTVRVSYQFNGFVSPLQNGGVYKAGRVIPVKINLTYADGSPVEIAQPLISVYQTSNQEVVGDALDLSSVSSADNGVTMRYTNNGDYIYNLDTKLLGKGTYLISVLTHNGSIANSINVALK